MPDLPDLPTLAIRDPRVGDSLRFDGTLWRVTGVDSYQGDEGYRVQEWCCETSDTEAYLLKEFQEDGGHRWFFTRWIDRARAALPDGRPFAEQVPGVKKPPLAALIDGRDYIFDDTTEGTAEDDDGSTERKTTWDYWDESRRWNFAVEIWEDGKFDFYNGRYIQADDVVFESSGLEAGMFSGFGGGADPSLGGNPFLVAGALAPVIYILPCIFMGFPFDECFVIAVVSAAVLGWASAVSSRDLRLTTRSLSMALAVALAALFWRRHPLTTVAGVAGLLGSPALLTILARRLRDSDNAGAVRYCACFSVAAPLFCIGAWNYFMFAPGPRTLSQLVVAVAPSAVGALNAYIISGWLLARGAASDSPPGPEAAPAAGGGGPSSPGASS